MTEAEWKLLRQVQEVSLDRFCQRVLAEIGSLISDSGRSHHELYLALFKLIRERDKELADAFNDPRRSIALRQLVCLRSLKLLTDEEFAHFCPETRESVNVWLGG